jgi:hypothetical protein
MCPAWNGKPPFMLRDFLDCMHGRQKPSSESEAGHSSKAACHLVNIIFWLGRVVHWDVESAAMMNDTEDRGYVARAYRSPWKLPVI